MIKYSQDDLIDVVGGGDEKAIRRSALALDYGVIAAERAALAIAKVLLFPSPHSTGNVATFTNKTNSPYEKSRAVFEI